MTGLAETKRRWDLLFALVLVAVFAYAAVTALGYPEEARLLPLAVAVPGLVLALVQVALSLRHEGGPIEALDADALDPRERARRTAQIAAWIVGFFLAVYLIGFLIAVPLAALAYLRFAARESWTMSAVVAGLCWALVFGVFDRTLHVPLPTGQLLRLLGS